MKIDLKAIKKANISLIISITALLLSFSSIYFQNLRINHSLKFIGAARVYKYSDTDIIIAVDAAIINDGNQSEVLYTSELETVFMNKIRKKEFGSYVLNAKESVAINLKDTLHYKLDTSITRSMDSLARDKFYNSISEINVRANLFPFTAKKGINYYFYQLGNFKIYYNNSRHYFRWTYNWKNGRRSEWVQILDSPWE
ncbi:MAG: hypothetical protein ABI921_07780 [Panacibacter sp.]